MRGTPKIDKVLKSVGRLVRHAGTTDEKTVQGIKTMLDTLDDRPQHWGILESIRANHLTLLQVFEAYSTGKLGSLGSAQQIMTLEKTVMDWLKDYENISEQTRDNYKHNFKALFKLGGKTVADLPDLLAKYRVLCKKNKKHRQFNSVRNSVRSFLGDSFGKSNKLYLDVVDIKALSEVKKQHGGAHTFEAIMALKDKLDEHTFKVMLTLCTTGMGWKESEDFEVNETESYIHIHGTKTAKGDDRRNRKVPLIQKPERPMMVERTFRNRIKKASAGSMTTYDFRRTYANWLLEAGVDTIRVEQYMGHQPRSMTERYARGKVDSYLVKDAVTVQKWLQIKKEGKREEVITNPNTLWKFQTGTTAQPELEVVPTNPRVLFE